MQKSYLPISHFVDQIKDRTGRTYDASNVFRALRGIETAGWLTIVKVGRNQQRKANEYWPRWP